MAAELPADLVADLLDERVRWEDLQMAIRATSVSSWDEVEFEPIDEEA